MVFAGFVVVLSACRSAENAVKSEGCCGATGAHVVLQHPADRTDGPADSDVQCAADLAAFFSKAGLRSCALCSVRVESLSMHCFIINSDPV